MYVKLHPCAVYMYVKLHPCAVYMYVKLHPCAVYMYVKLHACTVYTYVKLHPCTVYIDVKLHPCIIYTCHSKSKYFYMYVKLHRAVYTCVKLHPYSVYTQTILLEKFSISCRIIGFRLLAVDLMFNKLSTFIKGLYAIIYLWLIQDLLTLHI